MTLTLGMITMDTTDATGLAGWWADQTGSTVVQDFDGSYLILAGGGLPALLAFQKVDDPTPGKNRVHLDLTADDVDGEVDRLLAAGASLVGRRGDENFRWVTLADPDGNHFCVAAGQEAAGLEG